MGKKKNSKNLKKSIIKKFKKILPILIILYLFYDKLFISNCYGPCLQHCCQKYILLIIMMIIFQ